MTDHNKQSSSGKDDDESQSNSSSDLPTEYHSSADASIIESLGQTIGFDARVSLRAGDELEGPIVRTNSKELDGAALPDASRYRLDGEIARGGMGAILKGRDTDLGRDLAIKVLLGEHRDRPDVIQRFVEEAQIGGQLQHPGIVPVHELGQFEDGRPFFTMKLVKGKTLAALLAERSSSNEDRSRFLGIFEQICQTMAYAHSRGVIHRDLKPANIMVGAFGEVQVMDWGLAKVLAEGGVADEKRAAEERPDVSIIQTIRSLGSDVPESVESLGSSSGSHTLMGSVMGTPAYMPPEQALGEIDRLNESSDVFALGAILCEIFTGKPPYVGKDRKEVYRQASRAKLDDCRRRLDESEADEELKQMARDCLHVEPGDRFRDASVLADRVAGYVESAETRLRQAQLEKVRADTQVVEERKRRFVMMGLAASILATLLVGGGGWIWLKQKDAELAKADADAKITAMEQQARLSQNVEKELSTARALGVGESGSLADPQSVSRAVEAIERADALMEQSEVAPALSSEVSQLREQLIAVKRDNDLETALGAAWQREMEYRGKRNSTVFNWETANDAIYDTAKFEALGAAHPRHAYESAFSNWGLEVEKIGSSTASEKLNALLPDLRHLAFASLDRWKAVLNEPTYFWQWQLRDWTTLDVVKLISRRGDELKKLSDGSILASGDNPYAGYELEFETDCEELSALRLEAMLDDSLPKKGPGRSKLGELGVFGVYDLQVHWAPRSNPDAKQRLHFERAVADYSWHSDEVTVSSWNITLGAGKPHAAVFQVKEPPQSLSGFRLWISHEDRPRGSWEDQNLGRFRWSATADPNNGRRHRVKSRSLQAVVESADPNSWRNALRRELSTGDVLALIRRANDEQGCASQPNGVLVQLADALRRVRGNQLLESVSKSINWQVLEPQQMKSKEGVTLTKKSDHSIVASGALPGNDSVTVTSALQWDRISAIRLEFIPELRSDGYPEKNLGRNGDLVLRDCSIFASKGTGDDVIRSSVGVDFAFADYSWWTSVAEVFDGDYGTWKTITERRQPRTIVVKFDPIDFTAYDQLQLQIDSGNNAATTLNRFRISVTEDDFPASDVQETALNLLERMSRRDPTDYWVRLELARSYRKQTPPNFEDSLVHASAAVALQPDQVAAYDAVLRATPMRDARYENRLGRLALSHVSRLYELDETHRLIRPILNAAYRTASQCASDKDFEGAKSAMKLAFEIDKATPNSKPDAAYLNHLAWDLLIDPDNDPATVAVVAAGLGKRAVELYPKAGDFANTLGVAYCRTQDWPLALEALDKSVELTDGGVVSDWIGLAMAHWHLDNKDEAKRYFDKAVAAMDDEDSSNPMLIDEQRMLKQVRQELEELMGLSAEPEDAEE